MKRVLIFGGESFIGTNLIKRFSKLGTKILVLVDQNANLWRMADFISGLEIKRIDFCDYDAILQEVREYNPCVILNTVCYGTSRLETSSEKMYISNFIGSKNLLDACITVGFEAFLTIGSSEEYGEGQGAVNEDSPVSPVSDYGLSKALFSLVCTKEASSRNLPIYIVRPFGAYGPYMDPDKLIANIFLSSQRGLEIPIYCAQNIRDFIYIEDLIDLILTICQKRPTEQQIFNAGTGVLHTVQDLLNHSIELLDDQLNIIRMDSRSYFSNSKEEKFADWTKTNQLLRWEPKFNLRQGLDATFKWFAKNSALYNSFKMSVPEKVLPIKSISSYSSTPA